MTNEDFKTAFPERETPVDVTQSPPVDQSRSFWGGHYHPWRRYWARTVDLLTAGLLLFFVLVVIVSFVLGLLMPEKMTVILEIIEEDGSSFQSMTTLFGGILLGLLWIPVEAAFLSWLGFTPAKWLFGIKVTQPNGELLSFSRALRRSFYVYFAGLGLMLPLVSLITQLLSYRKLTKTGTTFWDKSCDTIVHHQKWGALRTILCFVITLGLFFLILGTR
ncbi:MAG: RDD family protein [Burkholderiales bacterium]|jgi:hypothetical protein|nr:RDD family protein [Burkholderiales bacterium]